MKIVYFIFLFEICFVSCNNISEQQVDDYSETQNNTLLKSNEAVLYSVPAPTFVSSVLKSYGNIFDSHLLYETRNKVPQAALTSQQTLNLGVYIIDFSYTYLFGQEQLSLIYLSKFDVIMNELNLKSPETTGALIRLRENINNNDSVKKIVNDYQSKLGNYFINEDRDALGLYVLSGMYIEGLYLTLGSYKDIKNKKQMINYKDDRFAQLLLQEETQLSNLLDLWKVMDHPDAAKIISKLTLIRESFDELNITYDTHVKTNKIIRLNFDRSKIEKMNDAIGKIRQQIIK